MRTALVVLLAGGLGLQQPAHADCPVDAPVDPRQPKVRVRLVASGTSPRRSQHLVAQMAVAGAPGSEAFVVEFTPARLTAHGQTLASIVAACTQGSTPLNPGADNATETRWYPARCVAEFDVPNEPSARTQLSRWVLRTLSFPTEAR